MLRLIFGLDRPQRVFCIAADQIETSPIQMTEALAKQAWFVQVRTTEQPPALLDFAVGMATLQEAIAAILHRPELDLGDEVTSTSELTAIEITSYALRPDEVRTYGRRIYNAAAGRWVWDGRSA